MGAFTLLQARGRSSGTNRADRAGASQVRGPVNLREGSAPPTLPGREVTVDFCSRYRQRQGSCCRTVGNKGDFPMKRQRTLTLLSLGLVIFFLTFSHITIAAPGDLDPTFSGDGKLITASAATITVTNTNDSGAGSLRQAIADVAAGGTINFGPDIFATSQTITLTSGQLVIDKNLTIQGPGAGRLSISGNNLSRVFFINSGVTATLDGITISNGNPSGDPFVNGDGGGIFNNGSLTVSNSTVSANRSDNGNSESRGGGIHSTGTLSVSNSTINGNNAWEGGGIFNEGIMTISNSTISGNASTNTGGGIFNDSSMAINNSTISGNGADTGGGIYNDGTLNVSNSTISHNGADFWGGGIVGDFGATGSLRNTIVAGNFCYNFADIAGTVATASHNLIGDATSSGGITNGLNGNIVSVDPLI